MSLTIGNNTGAQLPQSLPGQGTGRGTEIPAFKQPKSQGADLPLPRQESSVDDRRYEKVVKAAQNFFQDVYAVSDTTFTIYKDSSGQYITRITSLRDGHVTYLPEPQLLQYQERRARSRDSIVEINA